MNHRDREQQGRRRWFGRQDEHEAGRGEAAQRESQDAQSSQRDWAGALRDTYNPEPQWLRDDRGSRAWNRDRDDDEYAARNASFGRGRGSYASSGREWGEPRERHHARGQSEWDDQGAGQGRVQERGYQERDYEGRGAMDRDAQERAWRAQGDRYGTQWDDEVDYNEAPSRYDAFRVGTGMGLGPTRTARQDFGGSYGGASGYGRERSGYGESNYGSRAGWDLGTHQRDTFGQRGGASFRGLGPQDYKRSDERIREDVCERLTDSHAIDARNVMVEVNQGNVTLSGTVQERRMRYAAEDLVERIGGVANINNQLRVQKREETTGVRSGASPTGSTPSGTGTGTSDPSRH